MDMMLCGTCGNPYAAGEARCPYCGAGLEGASVEVAPPRYRLREEMLKEGMPTVEEAVVRLRAVLVRAHADGVDVVKLIHGYGSTGQGGKIRQHVRRILPTAEGVACFVAGEEIRRRSPCRERILRGLPALTHDPDFKNPNPGVTFVLLA